MQASVANFSDCKVVSGKPSYLVIGWFGHKNQQPLIHYSTAVVASDI